MQRWRLFFKMKAQSETVSIKVLVFPSLILFLTIKCFIDNLNLCSQSVFAPHITTFCLSQGKHFHHHAYLLIHAYVCVLATQSCPILQPHDCRLPGSSVHGISQARILKWIAISFSRGSSQPRDRKQTLYHLSHQGSLETAPRWCWNLKNNFLFS